jgi:hypothetical protein
MYCIIYGWHHSYSRQWFSSLTKNMQLSVGMTRMRHCHAGMGICMYFVDWTISILGDLAGLEIVYIYRVVPQDVYLFKCMRGRR